MAVYIFLRANTLSIFVGQYSYAVHKLFLGQPSREVTGDDKTHEIVRVT